MFKSGDIIDIKMSQGEFIGRVGYFGGNCIEIKEIVNVQIRDGSTQAQFISLKSDLVFYGNMVVMKLTEQHPYYKTYKQAISGIILPGNIGFN